MVHKVKETSGTQSVERTIALLKELAVYGSRGARVAELASRLDLEYPTAHRIIRCLVEQRMVEKGNGTLRYSLGPLVYELGLSVPPRMHLRELCDPITTRIAENTGDTVFLNVRSGLDALCIDRKEGTFPIKTLIIDVGNRRPLGVGAGGIALLMQLPEDELSEILTANAHRLHAYTNVTTKSILALVKRSKEMGYVFTEDIVIPGVSAVSLPFGGRNGVPAAAISVACVPARMPTSRHRGLVSSLRSEIKDLEGIMRSSPKTAMPGA
ncbi:MAG: hypothetical protein A3G24_05720 [Betaproteobacteria bacterium RIFCSPLOWO2_12_FULL_62_13]|nr:MAG: hypothetical protein A3G24_05720 [Betaproteobacteria bacterium RIFCSPLOWO2_12_FULL_62_13]